MNVEAYRRKNVAVIGGSRVSPEVEAEARRVGAAICRVGANPVCGGLGGVMEAACRGFAEERLRLKGQGCGVTVGILPGGNPADANPFVDIVIPTGLGMLRNFLVVGGGDLVVAVAGESGTLSELAAAWQQGKTIIALGGSGGWSGQLAGKRIDSGRPDPIISAASADEVERNLLSILPAPRVP